MSSIGNIDAILSSAPADVLESLNSLEAELQDMGSFFDMESFSNDFGLHPEAIAPTNDALLDASGYSAGAFDASFDAFGHVDPYYATQTGAVDPTSVAPPYPVAGDILTAPPELPFYGDAYGVLNEVTPVWQGLSGQQTVYVQPPQVVQQQDFQLIQEVPPAQDEIVWGPEYVEPQAWQAPDLDVNTWRELLRLQTICDQPSPLTLHQDAQVVPAAQIVPETPHQFMLDSELVQAKETAMPSPARPCKRKAKPVDEDIWPERPKRTKCAVEDPCSSHPHTTSSPSSLLPYSSPSSLSPPPTSAAVSLSPDDLSQLGPIVVEPPGGFYCPMPGCGVPLPGNDAAWRGHFRSVHHKDLCADARAGSCAGKCRYACPLPKDDDDGHKCAMPMLVESIGRHLLNVHLGLRHQCPLCGKVEAQRLSACKRHIPVCPSLKATTKGGETPAQEEKKKSARKPRTRKACK